MGSMLTPGALASQTTLQDASEQKMLQQLRAQRTPTEDAKIDKGAQDFEAMLLSNWLQQAEQSFGTVPGADDDDEGGMSGKDQMMSLGVQSLAQSMAASGGIGIAKMIAHAMHSTADKQDQQDTPGAGSAAEGSKIAGNL